MTALSPLHTALASISSYSAIAEHWFGAQCCNIFGLRFLYPFLCFVSSRNVTRLGIVDKIYCPEDFYKISVD